VAWVVSGIVLATSNGWSSSIGVASGTAGRPQTVEVAPVSLSNIPSWHDAIAATVFWVGETASSDNGGIANAASAWDDYWALHYGGIDDPQHRRGYLPMFAPKENPFYVALPLNDFDEDGGPIPAIASSVPWASAADGESVLKNQWVEIRHDGTSVFAQWEDVGPFLEDDRAYVLGGARPANTHGVGAGIDLSPAVRDYLGVGDVSVVEWRLVRDDAVPKGPWTDVRTTSPISWR
jgi:hypothetical protein